jgi:hypothetical protein
MNRTTTVVVALIAAAGLSTMVYAVPGTAQQAFAWGQRVVHHNSYQSYPVPLSLSSSNTTLRCSSSKKPRLRLLRSRWRIRPNVFPDDIEPHGLYGVTVR